MTKPVAALFVQTNGVYYNLPNVDPWDKRRDARLYVGNAPVIAHPVCSTWCKLAPVNQARWGCKIGDDGGMFASALANVRRCGGVLEHPKATLAWPAFGLLRPPRNGGWQQCPDGGWVCEVSQRAYGHAAQKLTWLYYFGIASPAELYWHRPRALATVSNLRNHGGGDLPRLTKTEASATPIAFRDTLLALARGAYPLDDEP